MRSFEVSVVCSASRCRLSWFEQTIGGGEALVETARLGRLVHAYVQTQWAAMEARVRVRKHKRRASKFCAT